MPKIPYIAAISCFEPISSGCACVGQAAGIATNCTCLVMKNWTCHPILKPVTFLLMHANDEIV